MTVGNIEQAIGGKVILVSLWGSAVYGIDGATEYFVLVDGIPVAAGISIQKTVVDGETIFYLPVSCIEDGTACASPFLVQAFGSVQYAVPQVSDFLNQHAAELMNMYPEATYQIAMAGIEDDISYGNFERVLITADIFRRFYSTGDFSQCYPISDYCKTQLVQTWTEETLRNEIAFLHDDYFIDYMATFGVNSSIHSEFITIIKEVRE